jgi:UDP-N-acetylmuramate--alanine ligase
LQLGSAFGSPFGIWLIQTFDLNGKPPYETKKGAHQRPDSKHKKTRALAQTHYLFCGIGGSGMLPLAMLVRRGGAQVSGSDRSFDQGKALDKQAYLKAQGVTLFPQDGSGMSDPATILVTSTAVEAHIPDVAKARDIGARHIHRADLLSSLFNSATNPVAVAGTSGKSTITAMLGWILSAAGREPTIVNGAVMGNFAHQDSQFASFVYGSGPDFVAEVDESDGSIVHYRPKIAILSNISIDHKSIEELKVLFSDYLNRAQTVILNLDNEATAELAAQTAVQTKLTFSLLDTSADVFAWKDEDGQWIVSGQDGESAPLNLQVFGDYNVSNALAAIAGAQMLGVPRAVAVAHLADFKRVARRMDLVGSTQNVDVYDDFGHNPDKIAASLSALRERYARIFVMFQPHGYRPMENMERELAATFRQGLRLQDRLWMTEPVYYGGSVNRTPIVSQILAQIEAPRAHHLDERDQFPILAAEHAREGDCVVIMGARDDTLTDLAHDVARAIGGRKPPSLV